jgi:hypothetical protein
MPFNVPEDQKPEFNKKVKGSLELLNSDVTDKLRQIELESADSLVEAYNQPVSEAELAQVPPSDMVTVDPQMARRMEIDALRMPDGTIYRNANELFSKPVDFNQFQAIGFVDKAGNATPNGELFFNLKEAGMFNEDGTLTKKGQAYSMSELDLEDEANLDAFETLWKDGVIRPSATFDEQLEAATEFAGNVFGGFTDLMQTFGKAMSFKNAFDVLTGAPEGKKIEAELQTSGLSAIEKITTNFANLGRLADVGAAALADTIQQEDVAMIGPGGVPMYTQSVEALQQQNAEAERDLYAARQRQWKQNRDIQSFEVGQIAETVLGLDGAVKMAEDAKNTLGEEEFNKRYSRVGAFSELAFDPTNLIPAGVAFNVAKSVPLASRLTLGAQKVLGRVAQTEAALADVQAVVQAGNAVLKKEALFVPRYQQLFKNMSAKAADNPELMVRANEVLDRAKQITASADEVRAAMPTAMNTLEELTVKRNSLATRIPEAYANKVMQTVELGRRIRSAPARTLSSILERTGNTLTKVDDAVTGYLKDRGLDQAYNAALGASGVVGLAGNPVVGAIGVTGAALKTGKFLSEYGKILRYVGKEMENARGQMPFWKRVNRHTAPGSLGRGIAHTFNIFELGGATSDIIRRTGRGIAAAYPVDLMFEWLSDGADMRPETMTRAAAESLVIGGSFAAGGGAFMGTKKRMRELAIGDEINFRRNLTDTKQKALYEALPPGVRRSMATYSIANPTLNYNFIDSGSSSYDINTNTANINVNSTNPLKPLVAHETLHHTLIKNNMEGGIAALFLGDTKTNAVGGLFRSKDGKLDPEFERFKDGYYKRLRDAGMTDAEIGVEFPLDKIAVEYFIDQHADQYATMAETGELGALAARGEVRKKLGSVLETVLPKIPVLRDLHIKSGGAIDANGAWVKGNGILGDDKIRQNPIANRMFREMNRRSSGMMPGQFEPLISDKEGSGAPLMFDPANAIDMELMHPFIQVDDNDKPILKDGRPVFIDKSVDIDRAMAGLTAMEAMRKRRESNYAPEKGEAYIDDEGNLQPGWLSDAVLNEMFAKHKFNNEQKRMIRQYNRIVKDGKGQRMVMINFPATIRLKSGKVVYAPQKAAIRDSAPVAITISKDGNILYGLMSVTKLQENIKKRAQSKRGKKLYAGNIDAILQDVQAMMDFHLNRPTEDSIVYFNEKYGVVEGDQRKKFINTMFGLLNKKEQAVLNPMLLEDGVKSSDNVYRTYRADRVSKAVPMAPEEYAAMPFSYEAVSQVRMPEAQRMMPEGISQEDLNPVANKQEAQGLWADGKQMFAINEMDEKLTPITSKAMLDSYPADAIGWMESEQATAPSPTSFMPEGVDEDKFYSQLERVITDKVPSRATPQQIMATIDPTRGSGVKADEIKWSGIEQALASLEKDGKVSKEDLLNYLRNEGRVRFEEVDVGKAFQPQDLERMRQEAEQSGDFSRYDEALLQNLHDGTKYAQYQLPGGENYREVVLAMPKTSGYTLRNGRGDIVGTYKNREDALVELKKLKDSDYLANITPTDEVSGYTSSHFHNIPNYVAHMRINERVDADGRPGLFVEEFQSDRHQEGRKKGYKEDVKIDESRIIEQNGSFRIRGVYDPSIKFNTRDKAVEYLTSITKQGATGRVADAPFRTTWPLQLFKRALRDAVDSGKEWVGWTTGSTQSDRFDLSKRLSRISYEPNDDGTFDFEAYPLDDNLNPVISETNIDINRIEELAGKEIAEKVLAKEGRKDTEGYRDWHHLEGLDLKTESKGMKGFYDDILPKEIGKYVKPFDGKVEKSQIDVEKSRQGAGAEPTIGEIADFAGISVDEYLNLNPSDQQRLNQEARVSFKPPTERTPIWKVSITPEMRQVAQGQMRFMPEKIDADYMKAVESGDVEAQQQNLNNAVREYERINSNWFDVKDETLGTKYRGMEGYGVWMTRDGRLIPVDNHSERAKDFFNAKNNDTGVGYAFGRGWAIMRAIKAGDYRNDVPTLYVEGNETLSNTQRKNIESWAKLHGYEIELDLRKQRSINLPLVKKDDSGNIIPLSKRFDITSKDLRFMPEPANPAAPNAAFKKPLSRTDPIPDIDSTLISDAVDVNGFAFDRPAKVYMQHPNGDKTYFNYDPSYLIKPEFKDLRATLAGKNIVILEADKMRATGGDMGGVLHPFLRSNQVAVKGDDGKMYKAIWANMNSGFVTRTKNRWFKDNATYAVIHLMDDIAHSSNKRVARIVDEAWTRANLSDYEQKIVAVAMQSAITAEQKAGYNVKITQAKSRIKSGKLTPEKIASENKAIADWLNERDALSWTGIDLEIAKKITQLKSAQTRLQNKTGNQAGLDKAKQSLRDYLDADPAHAAAFDSISKKGASLKVSDNIGNTFKSRGAAIQGLLGIAFDKFNPSDLLKKTEDFQGSENMDLVAAVQLSKNKDIFAVYFGDDPKEEAAMSASERKVRDKLRADPNFVEHEAFDWMMLGPKNADNFLAESSLKPEELIPAYRNQHPKTSVKNGSAETVLGAMKMFAGIPLTVAKKTKISNVKSSKKALAEQVLTLQNMK